MHRSTLLLLVTGLSIALMTPAASGWGAGTHANIANRVLDYPIIQTWFNHFGFTSSDRNTMVSTASGEPDRNVYQTGSWNTIKNRSFRANEGVRSDQLTWALSAFHVGVLLHLAGDASVPIGHSPARYYWTDPDGTGTTGAEAGQEAKTWSIPTITEMPGTTYGEKMSYHESRMADVARRYEAEFEFNSDFAEFFDTGGYNAKYFEEVLPYPAPLGVVILDDYFTYHNGGAIPEPATLGMIAAGSVLLGMRRRYRRAR
jgi:hypothetical protein